MAQNKSHRYLSSSEAETVSFGAALGLVVAKGDLIILIGDMGAGKTRLAKGIVSAAAQVGEDDVISPSFSLINRYEGRLIIDHADLYRLTIDQIGDLGIYEALEEGAIVIEWGEYKNELDSNELRVVIGYAENENSRLIELSYASGGSWDERLVTGLAEYKLGDTKQCL